MQSHTVDGATYYMFCCTWDVGSPHFNAHLQDLFNSYGAKTKQKSVVSTISLYAKERIYVNVKQRTMQLR